MESMCVSPPELLILYCSLPHRSICLSPFSPPPFPLPSPPLKITATLILLPILILLIWSNRSLVITSMIHCPGLTTILPSAVCPHTNLGFSLWPSFTAPAGLLSGNQPGRAHFSAHIILHIITNEYELPSVGHTRRKLGRERREGRGA